MKRQLRPRFWITLGFATVLGFLCVITPIWPDWIEMISGWDPDQHDGSVEWMIVAALAVIAVAAYALAAIEWRRSAVAVS